MQLMREPNEPGRQSYHSEWIIRVLTGALMIHQMIRSDDSASVGTPKLGNWR
jgi:hypothetical protein